jgi:RNA polymerase sigma factor (sigma-70 family)
MMNGLRVTNMVTLSNHCGDAPFNNSTPSSILIIIKSIFAHVTFFIYICVPTLSTTHTYTEESLVSAIQQKDRTAFTYLYNNYASVIYGTINRIITDKEIANDALQEVFVKIWDNIAQYNATKGRLFTWMINIARNYAIDITRSKAFKHQKMILGNEEIVYNYNNTLEDFSEIDKEAFQQKINELNEKHVQVINLVYFQGYNQEETAKILDIPLGTVKSRIRLAISELRKTITKNNI